MISIYKYICAIIYIFAIYSISHVAAIVQNFKCNRASHEHYGFID